MLPKSLFFLPVLFLASLPLLAHASSDDGEALLEAVQNGNTAALKFLLGRCNDLNAGKCSIHAAEKCTETLQPLPQSPTGTTADEAGEALVNAAENGHREIVQVLLARYGDKITSNDAGRVLSNAVAKKRTEILEIFLTSCCGKITPDYAGWALQIAVEDRETETVKMLLDHCGGLITPDYAGWALQIAVEDRETETVKMLLDHCGGLITPDYAGNVLQIAVKDTQIETVMLLLKGCPHISAVDLDLALTIPAKNSDIAITNLLKRHARIDTCYKGYDVRNSAGNHLINNLQLILKRSPDNMKDFVGDPIFTSDRPHDSKMLPLGVMTVLSVSPIGGWVNYVETILESALTEDGEKQEPRLIRTGQLGDENKESCSIAYRYAKSFMDTHYPSNRFFQNTALHLHVPEGATPKDGPSAGCTMATSLLSQALSRPIRSDLAMTGEITLTGKVLRIGGVKEKTIAAKRAKVSVLIFPKANEADWAELPEYIREGLSLRFVETFPEIAKIVGFLD